MTAALSLLLAARPVATPRSRPRRPSPRSRTGRTGNSSPPAPRGVVHLIDPANGRSRRPTSPGRPAASRRWRSRGRACWPSPAASRASRAWSACTTPATRRRPKPDRRVHRPQGRGLRPRLQPRTARRSPPPGYDRVIKLWDRPAVGDSRAAADADRPQRRGLRARLPPGRQAARVRRPPTGR